MVVVMPVVAALDAVSLAGLSGLPMVDLEHPVVAGPEVDHPVP